MVNHLNLKIENFIQNQSIQKFTSIDYMDAHLFKIDSLNGSSCIELNIVSNRLINIKNENDNKCFLWCVLAHFHHKEFKKHKNETYRYEKYENEINMKDISYPFKIKDLKKFH